MADLAILGARLGLYISLGLLAGVPLYRWLVLRKPEPLLRPVVFAPALCAVAFSALWLLASVAAMTASPITQPDWSAVRMLVEETAMGWAIMLRIAALVLLLLLPPRPKLVALPAAVALATLAWTGHAAATEGTAGTLHLVSDIVHMLVAALWLGALASLLMAALNDEKWQSLAGELRQFAIPGTIIVAALIATGIFNLAMIAGVDRFAQLLTTAYGRLLALKLLLFAGMLAFAGANRWLHTPRVSAATPEAAGPLRLSLALESLLWVGVVAVVAQLGTLDPNL